MGRARDLIENQTASFEDLDDLVCDFVEQEVGRHDWFKNLTRLEADGRLAQRAAAWLKVMKVSVPLDRFLEAINSLKIRRGRWR